MNTGAVPNSLFGYGKMNVYNTLDHTNPAVALSQPNGGENLAIGSSYAINWNATDNVAVTNVKIEYSTDGGSTWALVVASTPNTGTYAWIVPGPVNAQSRDQ